MYYEVSPAQLMCTEMPNLHRIYLEMLFWMWVVTKTRVKQEQKEEGTPSVNLCVSHIETIAVVSQLLIRRGEKKKKDKGLREQFMALT